MICVLDAALQAGIPFRAISLKPAANPHDLGGLNRSLLIEDSGKPDFTEATKALLGSSGDPVLSFISGIQHVQVGLRTLYDPSEPAFDFVLPEAPQLPLVEDAQVVPVDAVRAVVGRKFKRRLKLLEKVTRLSAGPVYQFVPPPPVSDRWVTDFVQQRGGAVDHLPSGLVRWKLWRLTADIFRERADEVGARFVDCPHDAVDAAGFMRDSLVRNLTHGNIAFGALVLDQIRTLP